MVALAVWSGHRSIQGSPVLSRPSDWGIAARFHDVAGVSAAAVVAGCREGCCSGFLQGRDPSGSRRLLPGKLKVSTMGREVQNSGAKKEEISGARNLRHGVRGQHLFLGPRPGERGQL